MALSIRNHRAESLVRELAERRRVSMTQVIIDALEQQKALLEHERDTYSSAHAGEEKARLARIRDIGRRCAAIEDLDNRTPDDILGYGDRGLPS